LVGDADRLGELEGLPAKILQTGKVARDQLDCPEIQKNRRSPTVATKRISAAKLAALAAIGWHSAAADCERTRDPERRKKVTFRRLASQTKTADFDRVPNGD
jgi:hypothetical protein